MTTTEIKKVDRRVQRTRQVLRDALMALIVEKGYEAVSIQDIADSANVNRTTFYLHFRDKEELLITSMEELYDDMVAHFSMPSRAELLAGHVYPAMCDASDYQHVAKHADFYRVMVGPHGVASFVARVRMYLARANRDALIKLLDGQPTRLPLDVICHGAAGMQIGLIAWWLEDGMRCTPEEMAQMGYYLCGFGTWASLDLDVPKPDFTPTLTPILTAR